MRGRWRGAPPFFMTIRFRLTLWYVAILAVVLLVFGGLVYGAQARAIRAAATDQLRILGRQLAATYDGSDGLLHPTALSKGMRREKSGSPTPAIPIRAVAPRPKGTPSP